jgi:hypothetical protein
MEMIAENFSFKDLVSGMLLCSHIHIPNGFPEQLQIKGEVV